jgi:hypothetical protein
MAGPLKRLLTEHVLAFGRRGSQLVFGRTATDPFTPSTVRARALRAGWKQVPNPNEGAGPKLVWTKGPEEALTPIALHEARHSAASDLIEAVNSTSWS